MTFVNSIVLTGLAGDCTKSVISKDGTPYAFGSIGVKREEPSKLTDYFVLAGFGDVAGQIALFTKGTPISVRGRMEVNRYTAKDGTVKESYRVMVDSITRVAE